MSSNNVLIINSRNFEVREFVADDVGYEQKGTLIEKGKTLEDAIKIAEKYCNENEVEYNYRIK